MWSYSVNHMLHGAVARIGGAIKRIEGADGAKYSNWLQLSGDSQTTSGRRPRV